jgi:uncharacterized protein (DUF169 family)
MRALKTDLSIFEKFNFENPPVAVKFEFHKPTGIKQLDKALPFCQMIREAQETRQPFYFTAENENCFGKVALGMEEAPAWEISGQLALKFENFEDARGNNRLYQHIPILARGTVNYVAFSTLDKLTYEPDLLILMATASQAEIVMRAMSYLTGELTISKSTPVMGCAWIYNYPYVSGKVNHIITGMTFGEKAKEIFPDGWILISIPWDWISMIIQNLKEMKWVLPAYADGREKFLEREKRAVDECIEESQSP